ncbi:MAG: thiamine diphosphokinase [Porphyromonas sp.]|nr:thiamine diphosphokinase [Porphyromonas sp.]
MAINLNIPYMPDAIVVAHGDLHEDAETLRLIAVSRHIVVCDGALTRYLQLTDRRPDVVIGDGDSVKEEELERVGVPFTKIEEQETNDLTKGVTYALQAGWKRIAIIGATGRREDHSIGNIFLLPEYLEMGAEVRAYSPYGWLFPFKGSLTLETEPGRELSLFAIEPKPMSAKGVAYPFEMRRFTALWQATLNQVTEPTVTLYSEGIAVVFISTEKR